MDKVKTISFILWPLVILAIAFGAFIFKPWQQKAQDTISVTAEGKVEAVPNIAKISATITSQNQNIDLARQDNQNKVSNLVLKLKELRIEEKDIKTQQISGGPNYDIPEIQIYPPRPKTNQISTTLEITIRNFDISDEVLATITQNGATNLYGPNLTVSDETLEEAKSKARENAVEAARKKAQELAKLSERKIGKVIKIQEQGDFGYPMPILAQNEADLKRQSSLIQPGQNEVSINLSVDFALK